MTLKDALAEMEEQLENAHARLQSYECGKEYRRLLDNDQRLKDSAAYIESLELEVSQYST